MNVNEIFCSIQGESTYVGYPTVFVRLQGCNLKCTYCDTAYAQGGWRRDQQGFDFNPEDVAHQIAEYNAYYVCFTGGEPLLQQDDVLKIVEMLPGKYYSIETNGTIVPSEKLRKLVKVVYDFKLPSAFIDIKDFRDYQANFVKKIMPVIGDNDEVKFVVKKSDLSDVLMMYQNRRIRDRMIISPQWNDWKLPELAEWVKNTVPGARLQLQLHKIIWDPKKRGV